MRPVAVSTPSNGDPSWAYVFGLNSILTPFGTEAEGHPPVLLHVEMGSHLPQGRHRLVDYALEADCSHILWLDDDMAFPRDTLRRLLAHKLPIVAANCTMRRMPVTTTAQRDGERVPSSGKSGLEEVETVGMAVMLTETEIFRKLPQPWFAMPYDKLSPNTYMGEDVFFCKLARHFGYRIMIDHDLSVQIGHVGQLEYNHGMIEAPK